MHNIYLKDLLDNISSILIQGNKNTLLDNFSKDTRSINKEDIYVGIKGEVFDGNTLYEEALEKGAKGCILSNTTVLDKNVLSKYSDSFIVLVSDTITCLQKLASIKRSLYDIPVIGITGSAGKTSTKDIIASVLSKKFKVLKTEGNLNNHIGVPLTILSLKDHNCLVVEMGMNNLGEISNLSKIAKPTISVITNVGTAHIGNLGSRENILKAKLEILDGMDNKEVVINNDNDLLHDWYLQNKDFYTIHTFGINNESEYLGTNILLEENKSEFDSLNNHFIINTPGEHFIYNALSGISLGNIFNIDIKDIKDGIKDFELTKRRMEIEHIKDITIINDSYNANPDSMKSAIKYLGTLKGRKIAILGDMLELGMFSERLHRDIGLSIKENNIDILITVGEYSKYIKEEAINNNFNKDNIYSFNDNIDAINKIKEIIKKDDNILIKASFGMNFIEIYNELISYLKK